VKDDVFVVAVYASGYQGVVRRLSVWDVFQLRIGMTHGRANHRLVCAKQADTLLSEQLQKTFYHHAIRDLTPP
jgi:hypothetical protein